MSEKTSAEGSNIAEYSVSEISGAIKRTVEDTFDYVRVRGELGRVSTPASGHVYLDLKDDRSVLASVIWRGNAAKMKIKPEQGLEVIATGKITTFPGQSKYQMVIDSMEPAGAGALMALLEERKQRLGAEGLFAPELKQGLPRLPRVIGVVTSPTGAVIRDILHRIADRFPLHVVVWPVRVQGETCGEEVARGIDGFNALPAQGGFAPRPDVLIVARGGGSLEDLWGFNDEAVVRAAARSQIPLISAVGHETDWTLLDLVADMRAPTPTGAAEFAVPVRAELMAGLDDNARRLRSGLSRLLNAKRTELRACEAALPAPRDILALPRQRYDMISERLSQSLGRAVSLPRQQLTSLGGRLAPQVLQRQLDRDREQLQTRQTRLMQSASRDLRDRRTRFNGISQLLGSLSYKRVLERGYAILRDEQGTALRSAQGVAEGTRLQADLADGTLYLQKAVTGKTPAASPVAPQSATPSLDKLQAHVEQRLEVQKQKRTKKKTPVDPDAQGSLF
ncbi:exodeoxyribonuclease VII large subunit [Polycladidibacter hongkongensis]|uniref:exodeoxyribonuclease VII large subunit n=1 Tax=Polycladidibacter hongkongensis TaxID=1647556 RepID=UPI000836BF03|nr:exodeoxyribonuclease VII large subunit [Pseudovibrio hongkongensis]